MWRGRYSALGETRVGVCRATHVLREIGEACMQVCAKSGKVMRGSGDCRKKRQFGADRRRKMGGSGCVKKNNEKRRDSIRGVRFRGLANFGGWKSCDTHTLMETVAKDISDQCAKHVTTVKESHRKSEEEVHKQGNNEDKKSGTGRYIDEARIN